MRITGNTILITGGGSGIGRGLGESFHKLGNRVIVAGRYRDVLEASGMEFIVLDTRSRASIDSAAAEIFGRFPELNVVINNAGIQRQLDFSADEPVEFAEEIETNIMGVLGMISAFLPHLKTQPAAAIINVSSGLAFVPMARFPVYCATKAFVHSFTVSLRHQLRNTGVRVIEIIPPWVATNLGAGHTDLQPERERKPMPLAAFIDAAMRDLASDAEELPIAGAKYFYGAVAGETFATVFKQINS